ncbi:MAG: hypothetical protein M3R68_07065 [Acidobacteriota bacterium]|nr:hypothetical protein [Acidobacteriota bacterium]
MKNVFLLLSIIVAMMIVAPAAYSQTTPAQEDAARVKIREQLRALLAKVGPAVKVSFRQSEKQPFNFVGSLREGLTNAESFEIVISVTKNETLGFRVYPHYQGAYINVDKVRNGVGLMRQLLRFTDRTFFFWGADDTGDVFTGYTITLESGFPEEALKIVLRSVENMDKFVGELRPNIDGSQAPVK